MLSFAEARMIVGSTLCGAVLAVVAGGALAAVGDYDMTPRTPEPTLRLAAAPTGPMSSLRIEHEADESGRPVARSVEITLRPHLHALSSFEMRGHAQRAFLEQINHPDRGETLRRVTVRVFAHPEGGAFFGDPSQRFVWSAKDANTWSVIAAE